MMRVFIPTKGRAHVATIPSLLERAGVLHTLVVEPQDVVDYRTAFPNADFLLLEDDDRGIVFSRQSILDHARGIGLDWYWQIDDNIKAFYEVQNRRCVEVGVREALLAAERIANKHERVALVALQYQQFAWSAKKEYVFNRHAYCCVLTSTSTGKGYRPGTETKEDVDFLLQHLDSRWRSILVNRWAMGKPVMGANAVGGLAPLYKAGKNSDAARAITKLWPQYCTIVRKKRGLDAKIDWRAVDKRFGK